MRVLVCGGRHFGDEPALNRVLNTMHAAAAFTVVVHGDARGADQMADTWARRRGLEVDSYPADWERYGAGAGPIRNQLMLTAGRPELVVAFPGGRGTADMVRRARRAGIQVLAPLGGVQE